LNKGKIILLIPILLLGSIIAPTLIRPTHAALTGKICLNDPTTATGSATPCPASPAVFDGPTGQQIRVGVYVQGSDALDGFDIILIANHTVLAPVSVDLTGTVLPGTPTVVLECVQGLLKSGSVCGSQDTLDTLHFTVAAGLGLLTAPPTTGLLFTAIYNISGTSAAGGTSIGYQTGCNATSVTGGVCVTIANGSTSPVSETAQGGSFDNSTPLPFVTVTSSASSFGPEFPGTSNTATITAMAGSGYPGFATDSVSFTTVASPGLTATLTGTNPCATGGTSCSVSLSLNAATSGDYFVTVSGTYAASDSLGNTDTLVSGVTINVAVNDFSFAISPTSISFVSGSTGTAAITLASLNGFAGSVTLSTGAIIPTTPALSVTYNPSTLTLSTGETVTSTATFSASPTTATTYHAQVKATSGTRVETSPTLNVQVSLAGVPDFTLGANPTSLSILPGATGTSAITVAPVNGFVGIVSLTATVSPSTGPTVSLSSVSIAGGSGGSSTLTVTSQSSTPSGTYTITVTGISGNLTHTVVVTVVIASSGVGVVCIVPSGTASCPASPAIISGTQGTQLRVSVLIQGSNALNGFDITLLTDHNVLRPVGISLNGTVLPPPTTILSECVAGVIVHGNSCPSNSDSLELAAVGGAGQLTFPPTTGLLFTAIYNVTANTSGTTLGYQTGCSSSSVSGTTTCVTIANGALASVPETVRTAVFSTTSTPDFVLAASPSALTVNAGSSATSTLSVASINNFTGTVSLNTTVVTGNLAVSVSPATVTLGGGQTATSAITISVPLATSSGTYVASIAGISGTTFHAVQVSVIVHGTPGPDFSVTTSATSFSIAQGFSFVAAATVSSLNGFNGTVALTDSSSPTGLAITLSTTSVALAPGGTATFTFTVGTVSSTPTGTYTLTLTGTSGSISHSIAVTIVVTGPTSGDFTITENPTSQAIPVASERQAVVTVTSVNGFSGNVNLVITPSSTAFACWFTTITSTTTVFVPSGGSGVEYPTCGAGRPAGAYTATITGTSGSLSHSIVLAVNVTDYSMTSSPVTFVAGASTTGNISLASLFGFSGTVTLRTLAPSTLSVSCPTSVTLVSGGGAAVPCTYSSSNTGIFNATIIGDSVCADCYFNGHDPNSLTVIVTVTPSTQPDFTISSNLSFASITAGSNATFLLTLTSLNGFSGNVTLNALDLTSGVSPPTPYLLPLAVFLSSGGSQTSTLLLTTSSATAGLTYTISVVGSASAGSTFVFHRILLQLQVLRPPDIPPVAIFSVTPSNPISGQIVSFDGNASFDPDGTVVIWNWSFGDGFGSSGVFTNHVYNSPGNYTVTLTVTDSAGLSSTRSSTVNVSPQPAHDVAIVQVEVRQTVAVSTQTVFINVQVVNTGLSNENVSLTAYANGRPVQTLRGLFLPSCIPSPINFCGFRDFFTIAWDTSGVAPGNYSISATVFLAPGEVDPTPADNSANDGTVTILPPPVITLSPNTGPDGTKVQVQGTGFPTNQQFGYPSFVFIDVTFDNMSIGFTHAENGSFTFTFDVPLSQAGPHGVFAFDAYSGEHASATFTVTPTNNNNLAISIDMGTIYFPGDNATAYILTTLNGAPTGQGVQLQVILFKPDGTNLTLTAVKRGTGLYKATYTIPSTGLLGTYLVMARAHETGPLDASALVSFEVKLPWLTSTNGKITVGATTLAGVVGLVGLAWKKGYLRRKEDQPFASGL
jgi:uncharacterized membrane protein